MVKIIADTTSCLTLAAAEELGVAYLPQIIAIGEQSWHDDKEITPIEFLAKQKASSILPKTAAPPPALYNPIFAQIQAEGGSGLVIAPTAKLSGTVRSAEVALQDFPGLDVQVLDTQIVASGLATLVLKAVEMSKQGLSRAEIAQAVTQLAQSNHTFFVVDTLEYLYKGGRIGAASALFGSLLQMKPILTLQDGLITAFEKQHTQRKALSRLIDLVLSGEFGKASNVSLMHGDSLEKAKDLRAKIAAGLGTVPVEIPLYDLTAAILTHTGPGVLAVSFFDE